MQHCRKSVASRSVVHSARNAAGRYGVPMLDVSHVPMRDLDRRPRGEADRPARRILRRAGRLGALSSRAAPPHDQQGARWRRRRRRAPVLSRDRGLVRGSGRDSRRGAVRDQTAISAPRAPTYSRSRIAHRRTRDSGEAHGSRARALCAPLLRQQFNVAELTVSVKRGRKGRWRMPEKEMAICPQDAHCDLTNGKNLDSEQGEREVRARVCSDDEAPFDIEEASVSPTVALSGPWLGGRPQIGGPDGIVAGHRLLRGRSRMGNGPPH